MNGRKSRSVYFTDAALMDRFHEWCGRRGIALGTGLQTLVAAYVQDLELQEHQVEVTLPTREVKFV